MFFYTDEPPSAEQAQAITAHTLYFIVAGRLAYKDSASQDRVTEFCAVYEPLPINRFRPIDGLNSAT
jgi:hypothetical protein